MRWLGGLCILMLIVFGAIPIGIITALVGVPFFVFLIFTRAQRKG